MIYFLCMSDESQDIPGMNLNNKYDKSPAIPQNSSEAQKELDKTKKELDDLKNKLVKKYDYIQAVGIIPPQAVKKFVDEEELGIDISRMNKEDVDKISNKIHLQIVISEEKFKEMSQIKNKMIKDVEDSKQNVWLHVKTPVDIWELCLDSKFDLVNGIAMAYPLYDKGILGALRVAEIHKNLVLQKFDRYVVSYVVAGSLVRGEAVESSDVDVFIVINDTDVKRMPRVELRERLRSMIFQYIQEASALAGVKNKLSPQIYLLTEFWESVKDASPVIFTFIRDGIPIYDRGTFLPWKALLKMGKLKPSPESIDMFMSMGDKTVKRAKNALLDILIHDIYWGVITPSQALLMLHGIAPPTPKQTVAEMKKIFVDKEKMLEKKYLNTLEKIVGLYKDYEHEKLKEIKGGEIDRLLKDTEEYLKRLKELREQIEKDSQKKTVEQIYQDVFGLLESIVGKKAKAEMIKSFENDFVKKGKFSKQASRILDDVVKARQEFKKGKSNSHKINEARKNATILINELIEYSQRKELANFEKAKMRLKYNEDGKEKTADLIVFPEKSFLVKSGNVKKITDKISDSNMEELSKEVDANKDQEHVEVNPEIFSLLKKELGSYGVVF